MKRTLLVDIICGIIVMAAFSIGTIGICMVVELIGSL